MDASESRSGDGSAGDDGRRDGEGESEWARSSHGDSRRAFGGTFIEGVGVVLPDSHGGQPTVWRGIGMWGCFGEGTDW